jgi:predicted lysophospholipase L1 biosynthesis ABC-type transport system permease subunit
MKVAQRQQERWERIEHLLILGQLVRGLLWSGVFAAVLAVIAAVLAAPLGAGAAGPMLLAAGAAYAVLTLLVLVPYTRLRVEFLLRLYQDVAAHPAHPPKRKPEGR